LSPKKGYKYPNSIGETHKGQIATMRRQGHTLQEIGETVGITRERARQILVEFRGSTATAFGELMTTKELAEVTGYSRSHISALKGEGIIEPSGIGKEGTHLWGPDCVIQVQARGKCKICDKPIPKQRRRYCSEACYVEANKYKNRSEAQRKDQDKRTQLWKMQHPEQVREIQKRASQKYQQKQLNIGVSLEEYTVLSERKKEYEEYLGEHVTWARFLNDMARLGLSLLLK